MIEMDNKEGVKLFGTWASPFSLRAEWALRLKGVNYDYLNEDLPRNKSPELLYYNPITKKVPTLVHDDRVVVESLVIIEYIDEVWCEPIRLMPENPYDRSQARFWARFAEDKCLPAIFGLYIADGEKLQGAVQEAQEALWILEKALQGKRFFGGDRIGYTDIIAGWIPYWLPMIEDFSGVSVVNNESLPALNAWFRNFLSVQEIKEKLPPREKLRDLNRVNSQRTISEGRDPISHQVNNVGREL